MAERERIARLLYDAYYPNADLRTKWAATSEELRSTFRAMADALLAAREGDCLCWETGHTHDVLMGDGTTETRRLPKTHCPSCVDAALTTARERIAALEHALTANADTHAQRIADLEGGLFGAGRLYGFECPDGLPCWCEPDERKGPHSQRCIELRSLLVHAPDPRPRGR